MLGVGRTLITEYVAAQTKYLLFLIICGDIRTYASNLKKKLSSYFELVYKRAIYYYLIKLMCT